MDVVAGFEGHIDCFAVLSHERKHVLVDDGEPMPRLGQVLQGSLGDRYVVGLDEVHDLDEGVSGSVLLAELADEPHDFISEVRLEVEHMGQDLFELVAVVVAYLVLKDALVEGVFQFIGV